STWLWGRLGPSTSLWCQKLGGTFCALEPRDQPGKFGAGSERLQIGVCRGDPGGKACLECKLEKLDRPLQRARVVRGFGVDGQCTGGVVQALGGWCLDQEI